MDQAQLLGILNKLSSLQQGNPNWCFNSLEALVLNHGRFMPYAPLPDSVEQGFIKECFTCSQDLVFAHSELTYVEGYATHERLPLAVPHAWAITQEGAVVDSTWRLEGGLYFGIALNKNWMLDFLGNRLSQGNNTHRGIFEGNYQESFSLLRDGLPEEALAEPRTAAYSFVRQRSDSNQNQPNH